MHRRVHKHTHNLSKHIHSLKNNYSMWRGPTNTHRQTHCHAYRKTTIVFEDGTNVVKQSIVIQCSQRGLFTQHQ